MIELLLPHDNGFSDGFGIKKYFRTSIYNYILFTDFQTLELFQSRKGRYGNPSGVTTVII